MAIHSYQDKSLHTQTVQNQLIADKRPSYISYSFDLICHGCKHLLLKLNSLTKAGGSIKCRHCGEISFF